MLKVRHIQFQKGKHIFSYHYDDFKELVNYLVDTADSDNSPLDLMDVPQIVEAILVYENKKFVMDMQVDKK